MSHNLGCRVLDRIEYGVRLQLPEKDVAAERLYFDAYNASWKWAPVPADKGPVNQRARSGVKDSKSGDTGDPAVFALKRIVAGDLILGKLMDRALAPNGGRDKLPIPIELKDQVSVEFASDVKKVLAAIPPAVLKILADSKYRYVVADRLTNAIPSLKGARPPGWPSNTTWDNAEGFQYEKDRVIAIAEYARDSRGQFLRDARMPGVLRHETGHALDVALADGGQLFSRSNAFKVAYERDVQNIKANDRKMLGYFLQSGDRGRSETFADCFALLMGGPVNESDRDTLERAFPDVLNLIEKTIKNPARK